MMGVGTMQQGLQLGRAMGPTLNRTEESGNLQAGSRAGRGGQWMENEEETSGQGRILANLT